MRIMKTKTQGFSLVELSIVLVILGLLTGGVLSGQTLIRQAELRAITTEYQRYIGAMGAFRDKYFALPGDMTNATQFWSGTGCNDGNGNGQIAVSTTTTANESDCFWTHLGKAGLIEGSYTTASSASQVIGTTNPRSKVSSAGWNVVYAGTIGTDDTVVGATGAANQVLYEGTYGNVLLLMTGTSMSAGGPTGGLMKTEEAWNLDTKMDDGLPQSGTVTAFEKQGGSTANSTTAGSRCGNGASATTATGVNNYDLGPSNSTQCSLAFKTGY